MENGASSILSDYAGLYDAAPVSCFIFDKSGKIIAMNRLGMILLQSGGLESLPVNFIALLSAKYRLQFQEYLQALFNGEKPIDCQLALTVNSQQTIHVLLKSIIIFNRSLQETVCHTVMIDITDYKRVQENVTSEHARLCRQIKQERDCHQREVLTLLDSLPALVFFKNVLCMYVMANQTFCEATGYPLEDIIGKTDYDLFTKKRADKYRQDDLRVLTEGKSLFVGEEEVVYGGVNYSVITRKVPIRDEHDRVSGLIGLVFDIREVKEAEQGLRESEEKYRLLFSKEKDAIMLFDITERQFIDVNEAAICLYGYTREEFLGMRVLDIYVNFGNDPDELAEINRCLSALPPNEAEKTTFHWHKKKDGTVFPVEIAAAPFTLKGKKMICEIIRDISGQYKIEAELRLAKTAAEQSSRMKSEFLAMVSHEIRTPMSGVIGMLDLLLSTELTESQQKMAQAAHLSAENLLVIINDVLDFSKIEADKIAFEHNPLQLEELLHEVVEIAKPTAMLKNLAVEIKVDDKIPDWLLGDAVRLKQVLLNLLGNAVKFTETGRIQLQVIVQELDEMKAHLLFSVDDTGIGIEEADVQNLFQPFTQKDSTTTRRYGGTGLGLAISKRLVELMGGEIGVISQTGKGSKFWFTACLPVVKQESAGEAESPIMAKEELKELPRPFAALGGYRVLLAEDNPINQEIVLHYLRKLSIWADLAGNGRECLEKMMLTEYDLLLLDCQMPELDGFETARQIRSREFCSGRHIPIIAMTAYAMTGDRELCLAAGMDDYISKPLTCQQLELVLRRWLPGAGAILEEGVLRELEELDHGEETGLIVKLVRLFRDLMPEKVKEMKEAAETNDRVTLLHAAHSLKSASAHLGALRLAELCSQAERRGQSGEKAELQQITQQVATEYDLAVRALNKRLERKQ